MSKTGLILANGRPPKKRLLTTYRQRSDWFVCADGGANAAARFGLQPDLVIGDLDSISASTLRKFGSVRTRRITDQNSTDLEKALVWLLKNKCRTITVLGATGGRPDHFIGNLSALAKFSRRATITLVDEEGEWVYVGREYSLNALPGSTVSLVPLSRCDGIVTKGLKWDLHNEVLELGLRESTSNVVRTNPVSIRVRSGNLLLYHLHSKLITQNSQLETPR